MAQINYIKHLYENGGNSKTNFRYVLIGTFQSDAIDFQECQHNIHADTLVAVHKGVV